MASQSVARSEPIGIFVPELDRLITETMDEWKVPGLAVAVVQNGEVALLKTYGLRDVEAGLKVTTDTQFQLMSVSKSFTATGLALLVDERRMDWKKPVREYIPEFRLHDAIASDRVTVRDLLCHHSGLPRHDWIWLPGDLLPAQMLAAMRYLEPSDDIRSTFQYSNLGYLVASMVAERVSGQGWAEFTRALTDKLHMEVTFTVEELAAAADAAVPYAMDGDTRLRSKLWPVSATAAGGMSTSIASFANWLCFHLGKGEFEGHRFLSPGLIQELQKPRVHIGAPEFAEYSDVHYGLGFRSHRYRGERVVWHGGGFIGTNTLMMLLPDRGVGVAILANIGMVPLFAPHIFANYVFDRVSGKEPAPWLDRFREQRRTFAAQRDVDRQAPSAARRLGTRPSHDLADYEGDYTHPGYGRITITHAEDRLTWAYRGLSQPLAHRHYDTFELPEGPEAPLGQLPGRLAISFSTDRDGDVASLAVPFEPLVKDIVFIHVSGGDCMDPAFRQRCTGAFSHGSTTGVVALDDDGHLTWRFGTQPTYKLRPYRGRTFVLDQAEDVRAEFRLGPEGTVDDVIFRQPNGTAVARRTAGAAQRDPMIAPSRHVPLRSMAWSAAEASAAVEEIVADAAAYFDAERFWPSHPREDGRPDGLSNLWIGAAGVIWALDYLARSGATRTRLDYRPVLPRLLEASAAELATKGEYAAHGAFLQGDLGAALVAMRIRPSADLADLVHARCERNDALPIRELMWGLPGSMLACVHMHVMTGEPRWRRLFAAQAGRLLDDLEETPLGPLWNQDLYGEVQPWLGPVHGYAGNMIPLLRGWDWLTPSQQARVADAVPRTLAATACRSDLGATWRSVATRPRPPTLCQHCHGAPGMVTTFADTPFASPALDALLVEGGVFTWTAGPLAKGSNLCHGTGGNGYAFLKLHRRTGDPIWLERARAFAMTAIAQCREARAALGRGRFSLWTGDVGLAIYLWDCITAEPHFPTIDVF